MVSQPGELERAVAGLTVLERNVAGSQTVTKVLSKDPTDIGVGGFLNGVIPVRVGPDREERVVGETVQERGLFDDLVDRVLDRRSSRVGDRVEVHRDDGDPVGKLLDVFSSRAGEAFAGNATLAAGQLQARTRARPLTKDRKSGKDRKGRKRTAWSLPSCNR